MAKFEQILTGNFDAFLSYLDQAIMKGSASASFEDGSDVNLGPIKMAVRVYERYSMFGGNRVSLNITLLGNDQNLFLSAITSGGSQAVLFKINTIGEETLLDQVRSAVERYLEQS
jgi:hypothetical protein